MNQKERMQAGLPYKAWMDGLAEERMENKRKIHAYNLCSPDQTGELTRRIKEILGRMEKQFVWSSRSTVTTEKT